MSLSNNPEAEKELNKLRNHIETRKASLEDEIEETIYQALADAKDSLELIRENIDPKVDKIIQDKMQLLDNKIENWKKDFRLAAKEEVQSSSADLSKKTLDCLDDVIEERIVALKDDLRNLIGEEIKLAFTPKLNQLQENVSGLKNKALIALGVSAFTLITTIVLKLTE